jgi:DNA-binding IclR family transcriptional regulator
MDGSTWQTVLVARVATGESSLARAVRILESFTPEEPELTVTEVAQRAGLHLATASRIVGQLVDHGLLDRGPDREVRVGFRMWELASRAAPTRSLRDAAMPYL